MTRLQTLPLAVLASPAVLAAAVLLTLGPPALPPAAAGVLVLSLTAAALVDIRRRLIPDTASLAIFALGLAMAPADHRLERLAVAAVTLAALLAVHLIHRLGRGEDGVGLGDVKLLAAMSVWLSPLFAPLLIALACLSGLAQRTVARRAEPGVALAPHAVFGFLAVLALQSMTGSLGELGL